MHAAAAFTGLTAFAASGALAALALLSAGCAVPVPPARPAAPPSVLAERMDRMQQALAAGRLEAADYQWSKVMEVVQSRHLQDPQQVPAEARQRWRLLARALAANDRPRADQALPGARAACRDCHQAQQVRAALDLAAE